MHVRIRKGLNIPISGEPEQRIEDANAVGWVALVAMDFAGLQPRLMVEVGDRVRLGQPLLADKKNPEVMFTSPGCGEIVAIHRGARRSLQSVVVRLDGDDEMLFPSHERTMLTQLDRDAVRAALQSSGVSNTAFAGGGTRARASSLRSPPRQSRSSMRSAVIR